MNNMAISVETAQDGRGLNGKFAAGNTFAKGHKRRQHVAELRSAFSQAVTADDVTGIVRKLVELAMSGDVQAMRLLFERSIGKPESFEDVPDDELNFEERKARLILKIKEFQANNRANDVDAFRHQ